MGLLSIQTGCLLALLSTLLMKEADVERWAATEAANFSMDGDKLFNYVTKSDHIEKVKNILITQISLST